MSKRFTDTDKYKKTFMRSLPGPYKLLWDYLYTDCNYAGIWHVDFEIAQIYLGKDMPVNPTEALALFNAGEERVLVIADGKKWYLTGFCGFQYGPLQETNRLHKSVLTCLVKEGVYKGLISPFQGAKDKDKDIYKSLTLKDKERNRAPIVGFTPPSPEQAQAYAKTLGFSLDGEKFVAHYQKTGWKIKGQRITDWKACVVTWKKNDFAFNPTEKEVIR